MRWHRLGSLPTDRRTRFALLAPFQVISAFVVSFLLAVDDHQIGLDPAVGGQDDRAIPHPLAGLDSFGEVYFLACVLATATPPIQLGISVGITSLQVLDNKSNGGEGGILRTPYKHRAIRLLFNEFQSGSVVLPSILAYSNNGILAKMVAGW